MQGKPTQNVKYSWDALQETPTCRKPARKKKVVSEDKLRDTLLVNNLTLY